MSTQLILNGLYYNSKTEVKEYLSNIKANATRCNSLSKDETAFIKDILRLRESNLWFIPNIAFIYIDYCPANTGINQNTGNCFWAVMFDGRKQVLAVSDIIEKYKMKKHKVQHKEKQDMFNSPKVQEQPITSPAISVEHIDNQIKYHEEEVVKHTKEKDRLSQLKVYVKTLFDAGYEVRKAA